MKFSAAVLLLLSPFAAAGSLKAMTKTEEEGRALQDANDFLSCNNVFRSMVNTCEEAACVCNGPGFGDKNFKLVEFQTNGADFNQPGQFNVRIAINGVATYPTLPDPTVGLCGPTINNINVYPSTLFNGDYFCGHLWGSTVRPIDVAALTGQRETDSISVRLFETDFDFQNDFLASVNWFPDEWYSETTFTYEVVSYILYGNNLRTFKCWQAVAPTTPINIGIPQCTPQNTPGGGWYKLTFEVSE